MKLYFVRHGLAGQSEDYLNDRERPLTEEGKAKTAKVAQRLGQLGVKFDLILTSPLVRAVQTAEILQKAGLSSKIEQFNPLSPHGNIQDWLQWWQKFDYQREENAIALVGHEPDLGYWTEMLLWGKFQGKLSVKKAGIIGLEVPNQQNPLGKCQLFWLTAPKLLL
jgi:phosphohistidine phosphatase